MIFLVDNNNVRLNSFIKQQTNFSIRTIRRMCKAGFITVNKNNTPLPSLVKKGDVVRISHNTQTIPSVPIIGECDDFLALYKHSSLHTLSLPGQNNYSIETFCLHHFPNYILCNRLDFYTSGIILLAKTKNTYEIFKECEKNAAVNKLYYAIVRGIAYSTTITNIINTKKRRKSLVLTSHIKDISRHTQSTVLTSSLRDTNNDICSLVEVLIHRGARHQIRAHLAFASMPLYGDALYSLSTETTFFLHNHSISFNSLLFTAPTPSLWTSQWGNTLFSYLER
ncbi:MAG: pseudouridine synthase family protein [Desulfovibrionaceae bacterium]